MADPWVREMATTIVNHVREVEPAIMRNRKLLALFQQKGRLTFNNGGRKRDWRVKYKRASMTGYAEGDIINFSRKERWKVAELEYRSYVVDDMMYKKERLENKGPEAIVKAWEEMTENLLDDLDDQFGSELYVDGEAAGNTRKIHGIASMMGVSGASATAPVGVNNDTYAGLSTALGNYGGSWNGSWPSGDGDAHYDFWTPLVVDYTSAVATSIGGWQATTKTWANTCEEALAFGIIHSQKNASLKYMMDLILMDREMFRLFKEKFRASQRINIDRGEGDGLVSLGFKDVINFDGVEVTQEHGVPSGHAYGWCLNCCELASLQDRLFVAEGPIYNESDQSYRLSIDFYGNNFFKQTRHFVDWDSVT